MSDLESKIKLRNNLIEQRDEVQKQITSFYTDIKDEVLRELTRMGIFDAEWLLREDYAAYYSQREMLILNDVELNKKCKKLGLDYKFDLLNLMFEASLNISTMTIRFGCDAKIFDFIKFYKLKVNTREYDERIKELMSRMDKFKL